MSKIDLRLLKHFGLSLNTNKKYFLSYDPNGWILIGIYDNLETALKNAYNTTLEEYHEECKNKKYEGCPLEQYVGPNDIFYKGFIQNLSVWELLEHLTEAVIEDSIEYKRINKNSQNPIYLNRWKLMSMHSDFVLSRIHPTMHAYPDFIEEEICRFAKID